MTALTAGAERRRRNDAAPSQARYAIATSTTVYAGGLISVNTSTDRAVPASNVASRRFVGIAQNTATGNTAGTVFVQVLWNLEALVSTTAAVTSAYLGVNVVATDDDTVTTASDAGTAGVQVVVGEAIEFSGSDLWVAIRNGAVDAATV